MTKPGHKIYWVFLLVGEKNGRNAYSRMSMLVELCNIHGEPKRLFDWLDQQRFIGNIAEFTTLDVPDRVWSDYDFRNQDVGKVISSVRYVVRSWTGKWNDGEANAAGA